MAIAHELRTPLTFLRGSMQGMLDGVFPIKQKTISDLLIQVEGLTRIVEDLRTLSPAIDRELVMQRQELDVALVVDAVLASANHCWTQQSFRSKPAFCRPDIGRLVPASGGRLRCETEQLADGNVVIRVLDRGPGFPEDMQAVAVNPFWRGDPSRSLATGGTGLGLSVVRAISVAHGGHLELANRMGGGAIVAIYLQRE
ncbi:HAMP domain-containing histidine kinase (plasmid) [Rhizobium leguminosarum bv. viciae]|nr:HAMP domain-containing histidine kinase [Rhizobium leguminosarum bv. viciae]